MLPNGCHVILGLFIKNVNGHLVDQTRWPIPVQEASEAPKNGPVHLCVLQVSATLMTPVTLMWKSATKWEQKLLRKLRIAA